MTRFLKAGLFALSAFVVTVHAHAQAPHEAAVRGYVNANVKSWLSDPALIKAVVAQNARTS